MAAWPGPVRRGRGRAPSGTCRLPRFRAVRPTDSARHWSSAIASRSSAIHLRRRLGRRARWGRPTSTGSRFIGRRSSPARRRDGAAAPAGRRAGGRVPHLRTPVAQRGIVHGNRHCADRRRHDCRQGPPRPPMVVRRRAATIPGTAIDAPQGLRHGRASGRGRTLRRLHHRRSFRPASLFDKIASGGELPPGF